MLHNMKYCISLYSTISQNHYSLSSTRAYALIKHRNKRQTDRPQHLLEIKTSTKCQNALSNNNIGYNTTQFVFSKTIFFLAAVLTTQLLGRLLLPARPVWWVQR